MWPNISSIPTDRYESDHIADATQRESEESQKQTL